MSGTISTVSSGNYIFVLIGEGYGGKSIMNEVLQGTNTIIVSKIKTTHRNLMKLHVA